MTDDIIKKVFEVATTNGKVLVENRRTELKDRLQAAQFREKNYAELTAQINTAFNEILKKSREVPAEQVGSFFVAELRSLMTKLTNLNQTTHDDVIRIQGMLISQDDTLKVVDHIVTLHDTELQKARAIYEKSAEGLVDEKRKLGERPDKLKDLRNYSPKQKQAKSEEE